MLIQLKVFLNQNLNDRWKCFLTLHGYNIKINTASSTIIYQCDEHRLNSNLNKDVTMIEYIYKN